jgi:mycothiol synthase
MNTQLDSTKALLSPDLSLRAARWADAEAVAKLILDVCTADGDPTVAVTTEELLREWKTEGFNLDTDAWVVETAQGQIVGFEEFNNRYAHASLNGDGYVHPDFMGRGIGTAMLRALDARALQEMKLAEPDLRAYIRNGMATKDVVGREMHEHEGYRPVRFSWRMEITLNEAPPTTPWPANIELRPFTLEQNRQVFVAHEEAFRDHWGHTPGSFERWQHSLTGREDFDPSMWMIAWDTSAEPSKGGQIAGYALCRTRMGIGWVGTLGVRRAWRKQGLGLALLYHAFGEFYRRGQPVIGLGVDAANPTGATRLYQKAGMHVANEYVIYEKEFRSGREATPEE